MAPLKKRKGSTQTLLPYPQLVPSSSSSSSSSYYPVYPPAYYVPVHPVSLSPTSNIQPILPKSPTCLVPSTADQREQARKLSHSAIERRRREKINDKILQLKELIPSCADRDHLHKMTVLQSAIEYIDYLKNIVKQHELMTIQSKDNQQDKDQNMNLENMLC
ncbi:hypothetical protein CU098_010134 [Rhizopus stolonifer]|uniref:BHLH domain-containing protein n=1 Tax=Rhizopus stolonifer TaxID=4846 RepID=A0A367KJV0_RHIST|nr:hypothetical protein CU098_010134 [Rhizopus stolonifer]